MACLPLFESTVQNRIRILEAPHIALFLDFDGTLAPICGRPADVRLEPEVRETLVALARRDDIVLSIVSGREVRELRELIDVPGLIYAGNHGLQIVGKHLNFLEPVAAARRELIDTIAADLVHKLNYIPGTEVEFKELSVAVHYRRSKPEDATAVGNAVRRAAEDAGPLVQINSGKMVWEIVPRTGWNKGTATSWIYNRLGLPKALVIYVGDDRTDEDAFQRFRDSVTIRVGDPRETMANYFLQSPGEVHEFLQWLESSRSRRPRS